VKRTISILFLAVIIFQSFSTLFVIGNFYVNRSYISKNLCVNRFAAIQDCKGKCYLAKELRQEQQQKKKFPDLQQKQFNLFFEQLSINSSRLDGGLVLSAVLVPESNYHPNSYFSSIFHPPPIA